MARKPVKSAHVALKVMPGASREVPRKAKLQNPAPSTAWFDAKLNAIGKNRVGLSQEFDASNKNWLQKILSGERRCQINEAIWLAERFGVALSDVLTEGLGFAIKRKPAPTAPIIGVVTGDSRVSRLPPHEVERVEAPPGATPETVALRLETFQSALTIYSGVLLYYTPSPSLKVMPGAFGRLSVVFMGDEISPVVGILDKAPSAGKGRVILLDGRTVRDSAQIMAAYPVEWTRSA